MRGGDELKEVNASGINTLHVQHMSLQPGTNTLGQNNIANLGLHQTSGIELCILLSETNRSLKMQMHFFNSTI